MYKAKIILYILFLLVGAYSYSQELPPIQVYTPQAYGAESQNWAISQSDDKHIYVANNIGLLEFNGAKWQLYPSPNETILRAVAVSGERIYTGCYMEFGYWERNQFGLLDYTSLIPKMKEEMVEDEHIWKIIPLDDWIVFQSLDRIYLFNTINETFKIIESESGITKMFLVDETIMFQKTNQGIFKIENGISQLVSAHVLLKEKGVVNIFENQGKYLIQFANDGFYILNSESINKWDIEANQLLTRSSVYNSIRLSDKSFLLGTISNGLIHLTEEGKINYIINQGNALSNNTVLSLYEDMDQNVWLGLDEGINCINIKSPFREFSNQAGNLGTVYTSAIYDGNLYLGTNQGLFFKPKDSLEKFKFINNTRGQVWSLVELNGTLFCGHNEGTFVIDNGAAKLVSNISGTWDIKSIPNMPNKLLQGNYEGLHVLEKKNGKWGVKNFIEGFKNSSRFFEVKPDDNTIYVNHEYKGVYELRVNADFTKVTNVAKVVELPKGLHSSLVKYNDDLLYAVKEGIFKYDYTEKKFSKDSLLSSVFSGEDYITGKLVADKRENRLWIFGEKNISYINPGKLSSNPEINKISISSDLRKSMTGFENIRAIEDETYLFGTSNGYLLMYLNHIKDSQHSVTINSVKKGKLGIADIYVNTEEENEFQNPENNIEFSFSVPVYNKYSVLEYRHQLEGIYDSWSGWSDESEVFYKNLPYGDYTFNVSARFGDKEVGEMASYTFTIKKPWYISNTMIVFYLLGLLLFSFLMHNIYKRYYKKEQEKLLEKSKRDLELKQLENEQQRMQYENEALTKDIESKNRELAISTMSLIKKNEFLNNIKEELTNKENSQGLKSVVNIIDKNLNNTDDWKFFEEAFNNADKDFLKKMKNLHPTLTSNDLRLCAYLRLNLSSKEIAPLLNISPRSVEVKRYRLRKKMSLPHETSLTNYILEV